MNILCFGDSLTYGYTPSGGRYPHPWPDVLQTCRPSDMIINEGMPGRTAYGSERVLSFLLDQYMPDITMIMLGSNDLSLYCGRNLPEISDDLERDGEEAAKHGKVILMAPPLICEDVDPEWNYQSGISLIMKELANEISNLSVKKAWGFFNVQNFVSPSVPDGLHINAESHTILGKAVSGYLDQYMNKDGS